MADSFIVESVFEIVESRTEEDEPELLHAEIKRAIPAKKITDFIILGFYDTKFRNGAYDYTTGRYDYTNADSYIETTGVGVSLGKQLKWPDDFFSFVTSLNYTRYRLRDYQIFEGFSNGYSNNFNIKLALKLIWKSSMQKPICEHHRSTISTH